MYTTIENDQITKEESERGRKELSKSQKIINKMAGRSQPGESAGRGENSGIQSPPRLTNVNTEGRQALLLANFYLEGEFNTFG